MRRHLCLFRSTLPVLTALTITAGAHAQTSSEPTAGSQGVPAGYHLVWSDEFDKDGPPDSSKWGYEHGFVRNLEDQWYQPENAVCKNGTLIIEARRTHLPNPTFDSTSKDWRKSRRWIDYTSSCLQTARKASWKYGIFEMRGRIDIESGCWPAWWTLGVAQPWPANGEIDIMEYYRNMLLANFACAGADHKTQWSSLRRNVDSLGGKAWARQFHTWRMYWNEDSITLTVDGTQLNKIANKDFIDKDGTAFEPFGQPHYMLLNLAIGGDNGGTPQQTQFPRRFEIDYVRVYQKSDRPFWVEEMDKIARPVIRSLAHDSLRINMPTTVSIHIDNAESRRKVAYLEVLGRTLSGIAPWLQLEGGSTEEANLRNQYRQWVLQGLKNALDSNAKDFMRFDITGQQLVDASYLAFAFIRAPWLWQHLDTVSKQRLVASIRTTRQFKPVFSNWLLFSAMNEAFLANFGYEWDPMRVDYAMMQLEEWYRGDGMYSDGEGYAFDYYNSYVIHPYLATISEIIGAKTNAYRELIPRIYKRNERYAIIQERLINTDGSYPATGRSIIYRGAAFHHLADMAWRKKLPAQLSPASVRCALTAVIKKTLESPSTFTKEGWLTIGLYGSQPSLGDFYNNSGSPYICSNIFLPLGLPETDDFWAKPAEQWSAQKIWTGQDFPNDHSVH